VQSSGPQAAITESYFEHRQMFGSNWVELWSKSPNPFLTAVLPITEGVGVELADISFNSNSSHLGEIAMNILFRKRRAALRLSLESATFMADNPNWEEASQLVELFEELSGKIRLVAERVPKSQECSLTFHLAPGPYDFGKVTRQLVREEILGAGDFYGVTRHRADSAITVDKSAKCPGGIFVRLQRNFPGEAQFPHIAMALLEDEKEALHLLGIYEIP
jgi:hypothetical protein